MNEQLKTIQNIEVNFKARKSGIAAGIFLVFAGILLEVACILAFREEGSDGIIATILLTLFFCGPIIILGICATFSYFASKKILGTWWQSMEKKSLLHI